MFEVLKYRASDGTQLKYGHLWSPYKPDTGKRLLFIPGLGGSVKGALSFLTPLLEEFSPIYVPDLRGFGLNPLDVPLPNAHVILKDLEAFFQEIIQTQTPQSPLYLSGISLGGVLATIIAERHPERFEKLVLMAPAYKPNPTSFSWKYVLLNTLSHVFMGAKARTKLPYGLEKVTQNPLILSDIQFAGALDFELTPGFLLSVRDLCNEAFRSLERLKVPTMMVVPGQDLICSTQSMREGFKRIPETTPKVLKEYPHFHHDVLFEAECLSLVQDTVGWLLLDNSSPCASA